MGLLLRALSHLDRKGLQPRRWQPPEPPPRTGPWAPNTLLDRVQRWPVPEGKGPEDVVVDASGRVLTGTDDGSLWRFSAHGEASLLARTGGRPLGIELLPDGRVLVCDAERGLLRVDDQGRVEVLSEEAAGRPVVVCNNAAVTPDGVVYFTDSSTRPLSEHRIDMLEHSGSGRLLRHDLGTGETEQVLDGLHFANGVGLSTDGSYLVVAETGAYRLNKVHLQGERAGEREVLLDNMPGIPDNLADQTPDGVFWVALYGPRHKLLDRLLPRPALSVIAANIPEALQPSDERYAWVVGVDGSGRVVQNLQGPSGSYALVTGVREHDGWLYLGSLVEEAIARVPVPVRATA